MLPIKRFGKINSEVGGAAWRVIEEISAARNSPRSGCDLSTDSELPEPLELLNADGSPSADGAESGRASTDASVWSDEADVTPRRLMRNCSEGEVEGPVPG
jgi:hypothetical protein